MSNPILVNISKQPKEFQAQLRCIRKAILEVVPNAQEVISYGVPTFKDEFGKSIIFISGTKKGCAVYISPGVSAQFEKELKNFKVHKATLHFDNENPLPIPLLKKIVRAKLKFMKTDRSAGNHKKRSII